MPRSNGVVAMPAPPLRRLPSLRSRLVRGVLLRLALLWMVGTAISSGVAYRYAEIAFDRALLDDALALATAVTAGPTDIQLKLTANELRAVLFDHNESVYFAVWSDGGELVAGHGWLHAQPIAEPDTMQFSGTAFQGKALRVVTVHRSDAGGFSVVMAQTTRSRIELLKSVLLYSILPELLLVLLLAWWLRSAITHDLQPLFVLQQAISKRDFRDLSPIALSASNADVQRLHSAINSLIERIVRGVLAQKQFSGNVAHELRTPLAGIRALAEYGLAQPDPHVWRAQLQAIASSEERASHMVEQLLALALADEARESLTLVQVSLVESARRVVLDTMARADVMGVDLGASGLDGEEVWVMADAGLLEGVLRNLLDNALRYGVPEKPGVQQTVTVDLRTTTEGIFLTVADNGPGIAVGKHEALMQRWQQNSDATHTGRSGGLGFAIVARYASLLEAQLVFNPFDHEPHAGLGWTVGLHWPTAQKAA